MSIYQLVAINNRRSACSSARNCQVQLQTVQSVAVLRHGRIPAVMLTQWGSLAMLVKQYGNQ